MKAVLLLCVAVAGCRARSSDPMPAEAWGPSQPVSLDDLAWTLRWQSQETKSGAEHFIVGEKQLHWLEERPIVQTPRGLVIWDGGWLARLAGIEHPNDPPVSAVDGKPISSKEELKKGLQAAESAGELALTVRARDHEVVLHLRAGEPITEAHLQKGVAWRGDGTVAITRELARRLLSDPAQVMRGQLLLPSLDGGRCRGRSIAFSDASPTFAPGNRVLRRLGFRHGDVMVAVNGVQVCDGPFRGGLLQAPRFEWALLRDGQPHTLTWILVDMLPAGTSPLSPGE